MSIKEVEKFITLYKDQKRILFCSQRALEQLKMMEENRQDLDNPLYLRLAVDGKGCDGFTYAFFQELEPKTDDLKISTYSTKFPHHLTFLFDPFSSFYLQQINIDYQHFSEPDVEGFIINNLQQELFEGKFWKKNPHQVPPEKSSSQMENHPQT